MRDDRTMRNRARELRKEQTPAEEQLWRAIRGRKLNKLKFRRQAYIDRFVVDFYCAEKQLIVEVDGPVHETAEQALYDQQRTRALESVGYRVIRFTNTQVEEQLPNVLRAIALTALQQETTEQGYGSH